MPEAANPLDAIPFDDALRQALRRRLDAMDRRAEPTAGLRRAAVALVVVPDAQGAASLVLTRRADHLGRHRGQFALPGGRIDPGETPIEAALRELHEEVGLELDDEKVLGLLDDYVTRSGYHMTPVVVWGGADAELVPDPGEVAEVHRVPIHVLADPSRRNLLPAETEVDQDRRDIAVDGSEMAADAGAEMLALEIVGTWVFAPTAALLLQMAELAVHGDVVRVARFEEPRFAWS